MTEAEVIDMNRRLSGGDASLNATVGSDGEGTTQWQDWLEDEDSDQAGDYAEKDELDARRALLTQAMSALNDREKDVLIKRRLAETPVTLEELSESYGVSRERIRQIEVRAFEKLQDRMRELARARAWWFRPDPAEEFSSENSSDRTICAETCAKNFRMKILGASPVRPTTA